MTTATKEAVVLAAPVAARGRTVVLVAGRRQLKLILLIWVQCRAHFITLLWDLGSLRAFIMHE